MIEYLIWEEMSSKINSKQLIYGESKEYVQVLVSFW